MTSLIILVFYLTVLFLYVLTSFFIVYHLTKFALASELKIIMLTLFVLVSAGLIFSNMVLFFSIDWSRLSY